MSGATAMVQVDWAGRAVDIEYQWLGSADADAPRMVFLHEGLGSVSMWRDFPARLCETLGVRGLVYSRPAYGQSTLRAKDETWAPDFMHRQAHEVLPALLSALKIDARRTPLWLFGHSDGGSIAMLFAAKHPEQVAGLVVLAPHTFVEDMCVRSIEQARETYLHTNLRDKLARHHQDPDSAFWGWNNIWLLPAFKHWNIGQETSSIRCPLLAVQGIDDEYGTLEQIRGIARRCPQTELLELPACGHSPHRDQAQALTDAVQAFLQRHLSAAV